MAGLHPSNEKHNDYRRAKFGFHLGGTLVVITIIVILVPSLSGRG
jgi:hypothetical protein